MCKVGIASLISKKSLDSLLRECFYDIKTEIWEEYFSEQAGEQLHKESMGIWFYALQWQSSITAFTYAISFYVTHKYSWGSMMNIHYWGTYDEHASHIQKMAGKTHKGLF